LENYKYALVTAACNEEAYIEKTIKAVVCQTCLPLKWIIVDDASSDCTKDIACKYASKFSFIEIVELPHRGMRDFSSQVKAQLIGLKKIQDLDIAFIGFLDADICFSQTYYKDILEKFVENRKLGVAGGFVFDLIGDKVIDSRKGSSGYHVAGGVQLFRRECFEQIGGYIPLKWGGQDVVAEMTSRMYGWEVRSFKEIEVFHLKPFGAAGRPSLRNSIKSGKKFYLIGYHPIYYTFYCIRRLSNKPFFWGSILSLFTFYCSYLLEGKRPVPADFVRFIRHEQMSWVSDLKRFK